MRERVVGAAGERLGAAEVVEQRRVVGVPLEAGRDLRDHRLVVPGGAVPLGREDVLPGDGS